MLKASWFGTPLLLVHILPANNLPLYPPYVNPAYFRILLIENGSDNLKVDDNVTRLKDQSENGSIEDETSESKSINLLYILCLRYTTASQDYKNLEVR